ncbi:MAG TPA: hypothetical protein VJS39_02405 [Gemmatimonadaceae bacterium]|nr:hypothetical protein [Gemmatimonadaceae bacterium]
MTRQSTVLLIAAILACTSKNEGTAASDTSSITSTAASSTTEQPIASTENAVAPEVNPPGDIPDTQAFVSYTNSTGAYKLDVPEGWARTETGPSVSFVSKFDGVKVDVGNATSSTVTAASVRADQAHKIQAQGRAVQITDVSDVKLPGGNAVRIKFTSNSEPNPVTNKQLRLENEAYVFARNGKQAIITLWAPKGADNVDQWQRMSKSFRWL